jgi:hypothetical protein
MQANSKKLIVQRFGDLEEVPIAVAPGAICQEVLEAIGERGAMALATGGRQSLLILAPAMVWHCVAPGQTLYVIRSSCPW